MLYCLFINAAIIVRNIWGCLDLKHNGTQDMHICTKANWVRSESKTEPLWTATRSPKSKVKLLICHIGVSSPHSPLPTRHASEGGGWTYHDLKAPLTATSLSTSGVQETTPPQSSLWSLPSASVKDLAFLKCTGTNLQVIVLSLAFLPSYLLVLPFFPFVSLTSLASCLSDPLSVGGAGGIPAPST